MNYSTKAILLIGCFLLSLSVNAQIGRFKKSAKKLKQKTEKTTETEKKKKTESAAETNNKSGTSSKVDFSELESQKMEWTSTFERLEKKWDQLSFKAYKAKKSEYGEFYKKFSAAYKEDRKKEHSDSYTQKLITTVDGYYIDEVPEAKMSQIKETAKESFDKENWSVYPSDRIRDIETAQKQVNEARAYLKQPDPKLEEYEKTLADQKAKITKYVNEGGLEKRAAEVEKRMVEKRRLNDAGMTDASVTSIVKSKIDQNKYGKPLKVVITSENWGIERDQYGQPKLKFVKVDIATKKSDGKCYYVRGSVAQQHEGGGVYGDKYLNIYYTEGEMNCNNVK